MRHLRSNSQSGLSFVELIFASAISVMVFGAVFISFQYTLELVAFTRAKLSALSLANERMEYFRSLPYADVGVIAGFPAGTIPQNSILTLNNMQFEEDVSVEYIDDPADGLLASDGNLITQDYKQIRLSYQWDLKGDTRSIALTSYIVPRSIETNVGGGTVRVNVLDADSTFLAGADVTVFNAGNGYSVTNTTNATGGALFSVPADIDYEVIVTGLIGGNQYSTSQTHPISLANPSPSSAPFSVSEAGISTQTFLIGALSDLTIAAKSSITEGSLLEEFTGTAGIASSTDTTTVAGGDLELLDTAGVYPSTGTAFLQTITPATLLRWEQIRVAADVPVDTDFVVRLYTGTAITGYIPISDSDLSGNGVGFTDSLIDISELDAVTYPEVIVGITLLTTDTSITPAIDEIELFWRESDVSLASEDFTIRGNKVIGTDASSLPIYKYTNSITTDGAGVVNLNNLEFDTYTLDPVGSLYLASACSAHPFIHQAGVDSDLELLYVPAATHALRTVVQDLSGRPVPGVTVRLQRSGYDVTQYTNSCGQTFFTGGVAAETDYELTVSASGYTTAIVNPLTITDETVTQITLSP